jgi:hypothetical protein
MHPGTVAPTAQDGLHMPDSFTRMLDWMIALAHGDVLKGFPSRVETLSRRPALG